MGTEIIVVLITSSATLIGTIITVICGNKANARKTQEQTDLTLYRISQLERKQDIHNSVIERVFRLEEEESVLEEKIEAIKQHIDDLHSR